MAERRQQQDILRRFVWKGRLTGLAIVILAAVMLEVIAAIQYYYTRDVLERNLEEQVLIMMRSSAMRLDGNLSAAVSQASNQVWHAQQRLDDPQYMETLVSNLVRAGRGRVAGVAVAFRENYYPEKGHWYEPYARWDNKGDISVEQIGSATHDYFKMEFYRSAITGDTLPWSSPYMDETGAGKEVLTYAQPLRDASGTPVAVLGIDISTDWIEGSLSQIRLHPSSYTLVISQTGEIISTPADSICSKAQARRIAAMIDDPTVGKKVKKQDGWVRCFDYYDKQKGQPCRVYYAKKKSDPKWTLVKVVHDNEAFGDLATMQRNILWTTLIGLVVLGLIITLFARNGRKLQETLIQQQRTDRELQIAKRIQQALLPLEETSLQGVDEVEVEGCLIPAREVGGDLFNVFVRDGRLFFCIGDVSGKGVPASLIMAVVQTLFHNIGQEENDPARIMERLNVTACRNNRSGVFVTMFIGILDLQTGHLDYCNAGHERPMIDGEPINAMPNMAIGVIDDFEYRKQHMTMIPGQTLTLYTDGLTEALNVEHQLFGRKRATQLIASCRGLKAKQAVDTIIAEIKQYAEHAEQSDDLTLLAIRYKPEGGRN